MRRKALIYNYPDDMPILTRYYIGAHRDVLGVHVRVSKNKYGTFLVFDDELRIRGIGAHEYAYTVVKLLKKWLVKKKLRSVPVDVFVGEWALGKYVRVAGSDYVYIALDDVDNDVYYSERAVAEIYISERGATPIRLLARRMKNFLSDHWLRRFSHDGDRRIDDVLADLCEQYGVPGARNYNDIIDWIHSGNVSI